MVNSNISDNWFSRKFKSKEEESTYLHKGEILLVFLIGYFIALALWLLVNLGREYSLNMEVPLHVTGYSNELAFAEPPPDYAQIGVSGEGWNLLSLYRNPPQITVNYDEGMVSIFEIIQDQLSTYPELTLQQVQPPFITVEMEPKTSKRVPVTPKMDVQLRAQYEIKGDVHVHPDSVTIIGAASIIDTLQSWPTEMVHLRNVQEAVNQRARLAETELMISKDTSEVTVSFDVTEFTEGEIRIYVRVQNVPEGQQIRFNPSVINVRYDVPIEYYSAAQEMVPYEAIVDYSDIEQDTTGFVVPSVRPTSSGLNLRLRSFQPRRVSYFRVIEDS
ncbi:MAG: hypothetical protein WD097_01000 [Balneolales bacterium]